MLKQFTERTIEDLRAFGCSRRLIEALFPEISASRIKRLTPRNGVRVRKHWQAEYWELQHVDPRHAEETSEIIEWYIAIYNLLQETRAADRGGALLPEVARSAAIYTIEWYLSTHEAPVYTADGVYSVIRAYEAGYATLHVCRQCESVHWSFQPKPRCLICAEEAMGIVEPRSAENWTGRDTGETAGQAVG